MNMIFVSSIFIWVIKLISWLCTIRS